MQQKLLLHGKCACTLFILEMSGKVNNEAENLPVTAIEYHWVTEHHLYKNENSLKNKTCPHIKGKKIPEYEKAGLEN